MALHELRVYEAVPGKLPALHVQFDTVRELFDRHGIKALGYWDVIIGTSNQLIYILDWENLAEREHKMGAFSADPDWRDALAKSQADGPLVSRITSTILKPTPYSSAQWLKTQDTPRKKEAGMAIHELRVYEVVPGRLPAIHDRFANITSKLFQKHGIKQIAYWDVVVGTSNQLIYMLEWESVADRETKWDAFVTDPEWLAARAKTEAEGPLVARVINTFLKPTAYSPLK